MQGNLWGTKFKSKHQDFHEQLCDVTAQTSHSMVVICIFIGMDNKVT